MKQIYVDIFLFLVGVYVISLLVDMVVLLPRAWYATLPVFFIYFVVLTSNFSE